MKVTSIDFHHGETMPGLLEVTMLEGMTSLFVANGMHFHFCLHVANSSVILPSYSILPAISLDGVIHLEVIDQAFTGHDFANFIWGVLDQMQPWPLLNSVLIMDNARIHKVPGIQEMVEERCALFLMIAANCHH